MLFARAIGASVRVKGAALAAAMSCAGRANAAIKGTRRHFGLSNRANGCFWAIGASVRINRAALSAKVGNTGRAEFAVKLAHGSGDIPRNYSILGGVESWIIT